MKFAVQHFEKDEDSIKHLDIIQALRWGIAAWAEIDSVTISNCWLKSRVLAPKYGPQTMQEAERDKRLNEENARYNASVSQISIAIQALAELGRIEEAMPIELFLNPDTEAVDDMEEDIFEQIAEAHADSDCEPESDDENQTTQITPVSLSEALAGLATLRLYEEQQEDGSREVIRSLNRLERELLGKRANQGTQTQIDSYFRS